MRISKSKLLAASCALVVGMMTVPAGAALTHEYSFTTNAERLCRRGQRNAREYCHRFGRSTSIEQCPFHWLNKPRHPVGTSLPPNILPSSGSLTIEQWFTFQGSGFFTEAYSFTNAPVNGSPDPVTGQYLMHTISAPQPASPPGGPNTGGSHIVRTAVPALGLF